ncbi:MAG: DUF1840 domain-containing protein [Betaproteobacteria bacterium]|nr:DUF1840 domain-containing protein [Betaproteobacteria bacterium]
MLVTFHSNAGASITMFGDVAVTFLKMMGHSGTVPSALLAKDVPAAMANLKRGLAAAGPDARAERDAKPEDDDADAHPPVSLRQRAFPLIELLSAAAEQECDVMWEKGAPLV